VIPAGILIIRSQAPLKVDLVLAAPPERLSKPEEFLSYQPGTASYSRITQECYRVEIRFHNLGSVSVAPGPYRGPMGLEILEDDSTNWISRDQFSFNIGGPVIPPGESHPFALSVPASAKKWRVSCSYQRWFVPQRFLNFVLRDFFRLDSQIGDDKIHHAQSQVFNLPP
jgi:hypothetical protein